MAEKFIDPLQFKAMYWPDVTFYEEQKRIIYSVVDCEETYVPAGHQLGKDFISGFIALWWICSRRPARVVTSSVQSGQLDDVLWGEIRWFIQEAASPLPIQYNHMKIRQVHRDGTFVPKGELVGQVVRQGESLFGRHLPRDIPRTLAIFDEASGMQDLAYDGSDTWSHRKLIIGNPYPCTNFFFIGVKAGDLASPTNNHYRRKVIRIRAEDSPNVKQGIQEILKGIRKPEPLLIQNEEQPWGIYSKEEYDKLLAKWGTKENPPEVTITPGVIGLYTYLNNRKLWDKVQQCIRLDGQFYEGAEVLMFPPDWLDRAERLWQSRPKSRQGKAMGVDPAEGGDSTAISVVDEKGLIELLSAKTPDTNVVTGVVLSIMKRFNVPPNKVAFDAGGGGKQHVDRLRAQGYPVQAVAFGASASGEKRRGMKILEERKAEDEVRYVYKNRRAEMYGMVMETLDPVNSGFALPPGTEGAQYKRLREQLAPIPKLFDPEGRLVLLPKNKTDPNSTKPTLIDLIGYSPDEADSLALALYALKSKPTTSVAGAI